MLDGINPFHARGKPTVVFDKQSFRSLKLFLLTCDNVQTNPGPDYMSTGPCGYCESAVN